MLGFRKIDDILYCPLGMSKAFCGYIFRREEPTISDVMMEESEEGEW